MRRAAAVAVAIMATLASLGTAGPAGATSGVVNSTLLGVYYGNQGWNMPEVQALEAWQGKRDAVLNLFTDWENNTHLVNNLFGQQLPAIWANHNVPMITWQPSLGGTTPRNIDHLIASGAYDSYIATWASRLKTFLAGPDGKFGTVDDRRAYLRFAHEMNGNWYPWSAAGTSNTPSDYVSMWQHVHAAFVGLGLDAAHLQWVWAVNNTDVGGYGAEQFYPGSSFVDWVGVDGYNWGTSQSWSSWQTPSQVFDNMLGRLRTLASGKPMAITETASSSATTSGASTAAKSQWITSFYDSAIVNGTGMVCWFNQDKETDWAVFGGSGGDTTYRSGKTTYNAYLAYKAAADRTEMAPSDPTNPRLLTDALFTSG